MVVTVVLGVVVVTLTVQRRSGEIFLPEQPKPLNI